MLEYVSGLGLCLHIETEQQDRKSRGVLQT